MLLYCENPAASQIAYFKYFSILRESKHRTENQTSTCRVVCRLLCACRWSRLVFWECVLNCDIKVVIVHLSWGHTLS